MSHRLVACSRRASRYVKCCPRRRRLHDVHCGVHDLMSFARWRHNDHQFQCLVLPPHWLNIRHSGISSKQSYHLLLYPTPYHAARWVVYRRVWLARVSTSARSLAHKAVQPMTYKGDVSRDAALLPKLMRFLVWIAPSLLVKLRAIINCRCPL